MIHNRKLWPAFEDLFGKQGACNGCWCMNWRIGREYQRRSPEANKADLKEIVRRGPAPGLLAFEGDLAVGWCQLTPRSALPWLDRQWRLKRVDDLPVWCISCFYIRKGRFRINECVDLDFSTTRIQPDTLISTKGTSIEELHRKAEHYGNQVPALRQSGGGGSPMTTNTIDESQSKAARVAGFFYLLTFAIVVAVNFGINERLMVEGNPAQTARNILAHERLFRIGIAGNLVYEAGLLVLLNALYVTLKPVGRTLALLAGFWRLVYATMWVLMSLNQLTALRLLNGADYLRVLGTEQAQTLGRLYLSGSDAYYVGLLFYGLASTACSYLFFKSGYIPRGLAAFGVIVSAWAALCTLAFIISPDFAKLVNLWWFDTGLGLFELATGFWLVIKGLRAGMARASVPA